MPVTCFSSLPSGGTRLHRLRVQYGTMWRRRVIALPLPLLSLGSTVTRVRLTTLCSWMWQWTIGSTLCSWKNTPVQRAKSMWIRSMPVYCWRSMVVWPIILPSCWSDETLSLFLSLYYLSELSRLMGAINGVHAMVLSSRSAILAH